MGHRGRDERMTSCSAKDRELHNGIHVLRKKIGKQFRTLELIWIANFPFYFCYTVILNLFQYLFIKSQSFYLTNSWNLFHLIILWWKTENNVWSMWTLIVTFQANECKLYSIKVTEQGKTHFFKVMYHYLKFLFKGWVILVLNITECGVLILRKPLNECEFVATLP